MHVPAALTSNMQRKAGVSQGALCLTCRETSDQPTTVSTDPVTSVRLPRPPKALDPKPLTQSPAARLEAVQVGDAELQQALLDAGGLTQPI